MTTDPECLFCRIVAGDIPATIVHEDDLVVAIEDINPKAPTHLLLMPRHHVASAADLVEADGSWLGRLFAVGAALAAAADLPGRGYRLVTNIGADAGQSVPHLHVHLLGGRQLRWPPG
jgi:histidine triad (HIT) family protein